MHMLINTHAVARNDMRASMKEALTGRYSYTRGRLPQVWKNIQRDTEITQVFRTFENVGVVRLDVEPDDLSFDDLHGDMFDESHADTIPGGMRELNRQRSDAKRRLEAFGQWRVIAQFNDTPFTWMDTDSIGGFVGNDFEGSGYETDLYLSALEGLFNHYAGVLPEYVPSKTEMWAHAVFMGWAIIKGNQP